MFFKIHSIVLQKYVQKLTNINTKNASIFNFFKQTERKIHFYNKTHQKLRYEYENNHVYSIMQSIPIYENTLSISLSNKLENELINHENFEKFLRKNWRQESATNITNMFKKLCYYAQLNNISLSDKRFDSLVDGLMDNCRNLTDDELSELLYCVNEYPKPESPTSHNFHDIWSALDDICCARINLWSIQKTLLFTDHWYRIGLAKYVDFTTQAIKKYCRKISKLSAAELVQVLFYINVCRKQWTMFDFEVRVGECINDLTLDELAIVSMAFFKTESTIKDTFILSQMLKRLLQETSSVHEITLTAILKIIRYSPHLPLVDQINELLTKLVPEIDRLSILCCVHIALLGTNTQLFHPEVLSKISEKFVQNMSVCRLKDLERIVFALTLYNFKPKTSQDIFKLVLNELESPLRKNELEKFPRCLACTIHYLGLQDVYSFGFFDKVLDSQFISKTYGTNKKSIGREILFINSTIDIDYPNYQGNRLNRKLQNNLTKWKADWIPTRDQKFRLTAVDKLKLNIIDTLEIVYGNSDYYHIDYILPHFPKPDIIICKDADEKPVLNVRKFYSKYQMGDIMFPDKNDGYKWFAIVVGSWNMFIRGTSEPVGSLAKKIKHLKHIGYIPVVVPYNEFLPLSRLERETYLSNKIL